MKLFPISLSIGILAGLWTYLSIAFGLLTWPAFVGWAIYFYLGGTKEALGKAIPPMIVGLGLGYLTSLAYAGLNGDALILSGLVVILAFLMTYMMNIPLLAAAPAAFQGCAVFFGVGDPIKAGIPFIIGLLLGYVSAVIPDVLMSASKKKEAM
ncbi:MAG: DUF1097 domain-containing protein [Peptococcaceae bacterium]|jgi:hypothetical protein|nr:DUF1097 domain-containing protein [Peptococcaceae bacterium]MDH7524674.1 DUF1097 domain-containing protein [Peptococcaceae bacterium]